MEGHPRAPPGACGGMKTLSYTSEILRVVGGISAEIQIHDSFQQKDVRSSTHDCTELQTHSGALFPGKYAALIVGKWRANCVRPVRSIDIYIHSPFSESLSPILLQGGWEDLLGYCYGPLVAFPSVINRCEKFHFFFLYLSHFM